MPRASRLLFAAVSGVLLAVLGVVWVAATRRSGATA